MDFVCYKDTAVRGK